ncbi:MAG: alpha/beta hydrolase [Micavibrio sp.]|nr:alpha/beta hydrolase [Micavibrio sp.]
MRIVFVHGWASDAGIWRDIAPLFEGAQCVELGFTGRDVADQLPADPALYVTHSLGTMWALNSAKGKIAGLLALNGFTCFKDFTDAKIIDAMKSGIEARPQTQLKSFCKMADMKASVTYDQQALTKGLDWLGTWDERGSIDFPVIALAGERDKIVPLDAAKEQWGDAVRIIEGATHNLPQCAPGLCIQAIKEML